jgi:hypothetical protein
MDISLTVIQKTETQKREAKSRERREWREGGTEERGLPKSRTVMGGDVGVCI